MMRINFFLVLLLASCSAFAEQERYDNYYRFASGRVLLELASHELPSELPRITFIKSASSATDYLVTGRRPDGKPLFVDQIAKGLLVKSQYFDKGIDGRIALERKWVYDSLQRPIRVTTEAALIQIDGDWEKGVLEIEYPASGNIRYTETIVPTKKLSSVVVGPIVITGELNLHLSPVFQRSHMVYPNLGVVQDWEDRFTYSADGTVVELQSFLNGELNRTVETHLDQYDNGLFSKITMGRGGGVLLSDERDTALSVGRGMVLRTTEGETPGTKRHTLSAQLFVASVEPWDSSEVHFEGIYWVPLSYFPIPHEKVYRYGPLYLNETIQK